MFVGESEIYVKTKLWKRANLSTGAPMGNLEKASFTGDLDSKIVLGKRSVSLYESSVRGTWREGSFTGNSKARSYHYPETGSKTDFGLQSDN